MRGAFNGYQADSPLPASPHARNSFRRVARRSGDTPRLNQRAVSLLGADAHHERRPISPRQSNARVPWAARPQAPRRASDPATVSDFC